MSEYQPRVVASGRGRVEDEPTGWLGWVFFAGVLMFILGLFQAIDGLVALFRTSYYVVPSRELVVSVSYTTWGWVQLLLGIVIAFAGWGLLRGQTWARVVAVIVLVLNALVNMAFMKAYPVWSILMIALDVIIIYAITVHGREAKAL